MASPPDPLSTDVERGNDTRRFGYLGRESGFLFDRVIPYPTGVRRGRGSREQVNRARQLRSEATLAERRAWDLLRDRRMLGLKFRRQYLLRGFIVDFYCAELRLILEIDGDVHMHEEQSQYDVARSAYVEAQGFTVVRLRNRDVSRERLASILSDLASVASPPDESRSFVPPHHVSGEGGQGVRLSRRTAPCTSAR